MDKDKKLFLRRRLLEERKKVLDTMDKMNSSDKLDSMDKYHSELSFYDNHPADLGTEMFMMEQDRGLINRLRDTLYKIDTSIEELETEKYGICISCGKQINEERLELIPYTNLCIECSKENIPLDQIGEAGLEEDSINPFIKGNKRGVEFDREDSYQEVARYNKVEKDPSFSTGDNIGVYDEEDSGTVEEVEKISQDYYDETNKQDK
ncbi:MAG: molecular chaperone DnaK [Tissierellia bacterium]|nr:molecular chaperone DnaK [Tissierellia bacterium]